MKKIDWIIFIVVFITGLEGWQYLEDTRVVLRENWTNLHNQIVGCEDRVNEKIDSDYNELNSRIGIIESLDSERIKNFRHP